MRASFRFSHWGRRSTLQDSSSLRVEVCPPSLRHAPSSFWERILFWLLAPAPLDAAPPLNRLPRVQDDFLQCIDDIDGDDARRLAIRATHARSLRELWHLRPEVFGLVALCHSQAEAQARLDRLNRHFPTRSPRSGFGALD